MTQVMDLKSFLAAAVDAIRLENAEGSEVTSLSPQLMILSHIPFVIPFEDRVTIFRRVIHYSMWTCSLLL